MSQVLKNYILYDSMEFTLFFNERKTYLMSGTAINTLSSYLTTQTSNPLLDTTAAWRQLILDHKTYIRINSFRVTISPDALTQYQYNPQRFLRENGYMVELYWIFLFINDFNSDADFNLDMLNAFVYVPKDTTIQNLYTLYISSVSTNS